MAGILSHRPDSATTRSPFQPGYGTLPPYLAGRESEQALTREHLEVLADGEVPANGIIAHGPRGNGKTALLLWSWNEAGALGIDVLRFSGAVVPTTESLARRVSSEPPFLRWLGGFSLPWIGGMTLSNPERQVAAILARRARKRPTLLAVDAAHMLHSGPGQTLLNEVQNLRGRGFPVMLILAGTPDLPQCLRSLGASVWVRSERLRIGRLELGRAADAVRIPFREHGRSIEEEALKRLVTESHGYPYFLQLWGDLLWKGCPDPAMTVSLADLDRVRPKFQFKRNLLYPELYAELREAELVSIAAGVAAEFASSERVPAERIRTAIQTTLRQEGRASDGKAVLKAGRMLRHLGYIWPVMHQGMDCCEPGIPSLMRFVSRNAEKNRDVRAQTG